MWAIKIVAKIVLSRLHVPYRFWSSIGIFRHGRMDVADYALSVFSDHLKNTFPQGLPPGATVLELGVGDSLASALVAKAAGAGKIYLVDVARFAHEEPRFYKKLATSMAALGVNVPDISRAETLADILNCCNAEYLTDGLASLRTIPTGSVDLVWSQAVLEHIRRAQFESIIAELARAMRPGGKASHVIDFKDHLDDALNNLRFSEKLWEGPLFAKSGFYTNRIQAPTMIQVFRRCGFEDVDVRKEWRWSALPTRRASLNACFKHVPDEDLLINGMKVIMTA